MFSGCANKVEMSMGYGPEKLINNDVVGKLILVEGKEAWRSPSDGYNKSTRNIHVLQNMADATLNEGYSFFAIARPQEISNYDNGSLMNTAEEFIEKCTSSSAKILTLGNEKCGFAGGGVTIASAIFAFKEQPKTMVAYDAKEVRNYLVQHKHYREDSYEKVSKFEYENLLRKDIPDLGYLMYNY